MQETIKVDKHQVEKSVKDWKKRFSDLYSDIKSWLKDSDYSIKHGNKLTMYEKQMEQFNVHPTEIDTADIYKDNKIVLSIKPRGLFIIGANGRIDILSTNGHYMIIDHSEPFETPQWKLYNGSKKTAVEFTKQTFLNLLNK